MTDKSETVKFKPLIVVAIIVTAVWLVSGIFIYKNFANPERGIIGDMFGAINALFSGLAFAGLIFAIFLQREELKLQREELKLQRVEAEATREEIKGQKEQAIAQNATLVRQTFENMFFQLLRQHSELISALSGKRNGQIESGIYHFEEMFHNLLRMFQGKTNNSLGSVDVLEEVLRDIDVQLEQGTGHYFRSLCGILRYADQSNLPNKETYIHLVRDQLSAFEVSILFYRCARRCP